MYLGILLLGYHLRMLYFSNVSQGTIKHISAKQQLQLNEKGFHSFKEDFFDDKLSVLHFLLLSLLVILLCTQVMNALHQWNKSRYKLRPRWNAPYSCIYIFTSV